MENHLLCWVWLTTIKGITNPDITALLEQFDTVEEIYNTTDFDDFSGIKPSVKRCLKDKNLKVAKGIVAEVAKTDTQIITYDDIRYPDILRTIPSPPYVLYMRGEIMNWDRLLTIGVVGTRNCTDYGIFATQKIVSVLAEKGVTIVSGMARGIDSAAARAALNAGNKTIAVLGCGTDIIYPPENAMLMEKIIENGTIISEYPPGTPPNKTNFPWRNRIISGLSRGILIPEAPMRSGALITADCAIEQGRDVFAVPGSINKTTSEGTNALLARCAKAVSSAYGILEEYVYEISKLQIEYPKGIEKIIKRAKKEPINNEIMLSLNEKRFSGLNDDEKIIIALLIEGNMHIDDIIRRSGFETAKLTPVLSMLEFGGFIQKIPGNSYKLNV